MTSAPVADPARAAEASLPPRPGLSRAMMSAGFMLTPTRFLEACRRDCGEYFTLRPQADRRLVITSDPVAVRQVFKGDPKLLHAGEANIVLAPILGSASTLLLDGAEHLRHRKLLLPPFHGERMRAYEEAITQIAERHVAGWPRGRRFGVLDGMQAITLEVIEQAVLGVESAERRAEVSRPLRRLLDMIGSRAWILALIAAGDRGGPRSPWGKLRMARAEADLVLDRQIAERRADPRADERGDILSLLLDARDEDGEGLSDQALRDELVTLLVAGHETTASALAWTLERLSREPRVLDRLLDSLSSGSDEYLEATIKESLRLRPVVPAVARRLQAPMRFGPWDLPAGVHIAPSIFLLHRRPDLYPEPLEFRPERFLGPDAPGTYEWIPFGGGVRRCLGASFALFEIKAVLKVVLSQTQLERTPGRRPEGVTRRAITFAPSRGGRIALA